MDRTCMYHDSCGLEYCMMGIDCPEYKKKDKPILFNTEMVKAILDGRKTTTRRIVKPQGIKCYKGAYNKPCTGGYGLNTAANSLYCTECGNIIEYSPEGKDYCRTIDAPYRKGDTLWVRETWSTHYDGIHDGLIYCYKADGINLSSECLPGENNRWYPSIHMPREAARLFLKVTDVRVERLQDISHKDCMKEGAGEILLNINHPLREKAYARGQYIKKYDDMFAGAKEAFAALWDNTVKKQDINRYGWEANPWVWVIDFERVR